eukprot:PLAT8818.1.p1 GENE.PLAT8818.1~~PLAT8818.1.p1  ORF type:complete len:444 (+),score=228.73 PLAT8818.1:33-1364(+)
MAAGVTRLIRQISGEGVSLSTVISQIVSCDGDDDLGALQRSLVGMKDRLAKKERLLQDAFPQLDVEKHTLGALLLLYAKCEDKADVSAFRTLARKVLLTGNSAQLAMARRQLSAVCRAYLTACQAAGEVKAAVKPLRRAVASLGVVETVTPVHVDFMQACLLSKCYHVAAAVAGEDMFTVDPADSGLTTTDLLRYFLYAAMVNIGLQRLETALTQLTVVVSAPAAVVSAVQIAAWKKRVLVSLILRGTVIELPKYTAMCVTMSRESGSEYNRLAEAFASPSAEMLRMVATECEAAFVADRNLGLVKQVLRAHVRRGVQRLTDTYVTLSLDDIASTVGLAGGKEVEALVLDMIVSGDVHAHIDKRNGMVAFSEAADTYDGIATMHTLQKHVGEAMLLEERLRAVDEDISSSFTYLHRVVTREGWGAADAPAAAGMAGASGMAGL